MIVIPALEKDLIMMPGVAAHKNQFLTLEM
jgi:hypothetical protein